ncbi:MAG: secretion protein HlyD [Verrucomicrobia bacterium]|nr:secretion protein HlyD [Verrucomicrobiota bacterium]MBV8485214.1 secretion protein HlyD [Verrucomicrobiota bacterium]
MRKRLVIILGVVAVLSVAGWFIYQQFTTTPQRILTLQGNIDIRQVNVGFRVTGRVKEMKLEEGDVVHAGDLIATLDDVPYQDQVRLAEAQVAQAQANYTKMMNGYRPEEIEQAKAQLAQAKANYQNALRYFERQDALQQSHVISKSDYDNALASRDSLKGQVDLAQANLNLELAGNRFEDIDSAKAQLENSRANLATARQNVDDCKLFAPVDGVIITRAVEPGTIVSTSSIIYSVCQNEPIWVRTYVDERDLGRIYPGMKALVYNDTDPNHPYVGQIGFISPVAEFTPKNVETRELRTDLVYRLRVIIEKPDRYLRQGMPVTLRMVDEHHEPEQPRR